MPVMPVCVISRWPKSASTPAEPIGTGRAIVQPYGRPELVELEGLDHFAPGECGLPPD